MKKLILLASVIACLLPIPSMAQDSTTQTTESATTVPAALNPVSRKLKGDKFNKMHESFLKRGKEGEIGVLFMGDSITERWTTAPKIWNDHFGKWKPANFGIGGDRTQHVIWRIEHGELDGISPKVMVLMIGTNNTNSDPAQDIVAAIKRILELSHEKMPKTKILLLGIFPRGDKQGNMDNKQMNVIRQVNPEIAKLADGKTVHYLDIGDKFLVNGKIPFETMPDQLHPEVKGYEIWADAIQPKLEELMK